MIKVIVTFSVVFYLVGACFGLIFSTPILWVFTAAMVWAEISMFRNRNGKSFRQEVLPAIVIGAAGILGLWTPPDLVISVTSRVSSFIFR